MKYKWFFNPYSKYEIIEETQDWLYCKEKENFEVDREKNFWANYLATNKEFSLDKEAFENCPFKNKIFKNYNVDFIVITGSYCYKAFDTVSDYDLDVFISNADNFLHSDKECLFYKGRKVHWYYWTIDKLINDNTFDSKVLALETYFLKPEFILYANADQNILLKNKNKISYIGILKFLSNLNQTVQWTSCYLYICYCILKKLNIDPQFLLKIKRQLYIPLSKKDTDQMQLILKWLLDYRQSINVNSELLKLTV